MLRSGSICSGIEAASTAWGPLGWKPAFFAEVEPFPCAVLDHHWSHVPNLGDMTKINGEAWHGKIDVLVGGTPCQAFSIAGARRGLEDARGNLTLTFARLADAIQPDFVVWENVPGVLSDKTNAFGCLLGMLAGEDEALIPPGKKWTNAGYVLGPERTIVWRVFDAQYFGVAQRRRRVFLVACPRNGTDPREILFEREGVRRDSAPSRETGQGAAGSAEAGVGGGGEPIAFNWQENQTFHASTCTTNPLRRNQTEAVLAFGGNNTSGPIDVATACNACASSSGRLDFESETFVTHSLRGEGLDASEDGTGQGTPLVPVAFTQNQIGDVLTGEVCAALSTNQNATGRNTAKVIYYKNQWRVRRLTPVECHRLQGFPDHHCQIPWRGKPASECPDGPQYKALGNSMAVPCMNWIGRRIELVARRNAVSQNPFSRLFSALERITEALERIAA